MVTKKDKRKTTALQDLRVMRMDGVDSPATGEDFLILKSDDPDEVQANLAAFINKNREALRLLAKEDIRQPELIAMLNELVSMTATDDDEDDALPAFKACGTKGKKSTKKEDEAATAAAAATAKGRKDGDEDEEDEEEEGGDEEIHAAEKTASDETLSDSAVEKVAKKMIELLGGTDKSKLASRQVGDETVTKSTSAKKLGRGLFESVIFGQ